MPADGKDAGSTRADNKIITMKDLEKMAHQTAGGGPVSGIKGKLAAAGLASGVIPGNVEFI
jgi:hypothetical protein